MGKELRNNIITAIVTASLTAVGFFGKELYDEKNRKEQFVMELHKELYNKGASELDNFNKAYSELHSLFSKGYGLTTYELDPKYEDFKKAIESYQRYLDELERYGNSSQVQVAKNLNEWIWAIYAQFKMQYDLAEQVQNRSRELLHADDPDSDWFKTINKLLDADLERMIQDENRTYYVTSLNQMPVIRGLEQYFNYQFRLSLGLDATTDMEKTIKELPELVKRKSDTEYKDKALPFVFAEGRVFEAPTLEFEGETSILKYKDDALKYQIKMKFLSLVIKNDKQLQSFLEERKKSKSAGKKP